MTTFLFCLANQLSGPAWASPKIVSATTAERQVRANVDKFLTPGPFLKSGSMITPLANAYYELTKDRESDVKLLRMTLLYVYSGQDVDALKSRERVVYKAVLDLLWSRRRGISSFELQRAGALYAVAEEHHSIIGTDFIERLESFQSDPYLMSARMVEDCRDENDDPKLLYAQRAADELLKVKYCQYRFTSAALSYYITAGVRAKDKKLVNRATGLLRKQASWVPTDHPSYSAKRLLEKADGLEKLAASWGK